MFEKSDFLKLYSWIDSIPLSRPKKNINRDFSDGVLMAEVMKYYFPSMVDLHNYISANGTKQKTENWNLINSKIFHKLGFDLGTDEIRDIVACKVHAIERVLFYILDNVTTWAQKSGKIKDREFAKHVDKPATDEGRNIYRNKVCNREVCGGCIAIAEKDELIDILEKKIHRLENLICLKDIRIDELSLKVKNLEQMVLSQR